MQRLQVQRLQLRLMLLVSAVSRGHAEAPRARRGEVGHGIVELAADGAAQAPTYEQWLEGQCDLGLLVVDIDDYLNGSHE